jgi:hypothetical protein
VDGGRGIGATGFMSLVLFEYISVVVVKGACVRACRGLGLCTLGIVGLSVGNNCVRRSFSVVIGGGRIGGGGEDGDRVDEKEQIE